MDKYEIYSNPPKKFSGRVLIIKPDYFLCAHKSNAIIENHTKGNLYIVVSKVI